MSIWIRLFQHSDFHGRSTFANLPLTTTPDTYLQISQSWLKSVGLHDNISSLEIGSSDTESGGNIILFQHDHYHGRYTLFPATPGTTVRTPSLTSEGFHDITSSVLVVRRFTRELPPIAIGDMGSPSLRQQVSDLAESFPSSSLRGSPIITWDMWPSFSPSRKYVYIRVPAELKLPNWPNYDIEIRFWIYLFINDGGNVRGHVAWYGAWVEGGILSGSILDRLMDRIPSVLGDINRNISNALSMLESLTFVKLYYLPGRASHVGHVNDDVSIVLVKEI